MNTAQALPAPETTLIFGDCLDEIPKLPRASVDLVLCDLPFGVTQAEWDQPINLGALWWAYSKVLKTTGNVVLFGVQPFSTDLVRSAPHLFRYSMVWEKNKPRGHLNVKKRPMMAHEDVLVFGRPGAFYHPVMSQGHTPQNEATNAGSTLYGAVKPTRSRSGATDRYPTSILRFPVVNNDDPSRIHPTQKPVPLLEHLISLFCPPGGTVLDNAMGSGATIVAANNVGRGAIGIESNAEFFEAARARIAPTPPICEPQEK